MFSSFRQQATALLVRTLYLAVLVLGRAVLGATHILSRRDSEHPQAHHQRPVVQMLREEWSQTATP